MIKDILRWFGRSMEEEPGQPSSTRLVIVIGSLSIIFCLCSAWVAVSIYKRDLAEIPASVGATLGSYLLALLGAKVIQRNTENKSE